MYATDMLSYTCFLPLTFLFDLISWTISQKMAKKTEADLADEQTDEDMVDGEGKITYHPDIFF